jgi:hypothetical protein
MPGGRPSKIHLSVKVTNGETGAKEEIPITEAICRMVSLGVWPGNAAQCYGVSRQTLHSWRTRGEAAHAAAAEHTPDGEEVDYESMPEEDRPFAEFLDALSCAEARGLAWHELNVRKAASGNREAGGRLSLEFLARRQRDQYAREVKLEHGGKVMVEVEAEVDEAIEGLVEQLGAGDPSDPRGD